MKKSNFFIVFIILLGTFILAKSPSIFVDKTIIKLGYLKPHSKTPFKFTIYNSGEAPLVIKSILHTCGCTKLKYDSKVIPPDGKMVVHGILRTYGARGPIIKYIYVYSNSPGKEKVEVRLMAYVRAEVEATPENIRIEYPMSGKFKENILINYYGKGEFKISKVLEDKKLFKLLLVRRTDTAYNLYLTLLNNKINGDLSDFISVYSNSKEVPILKIPVYIAKKKYFTIFPDYLKLGIIRSDKPIIRRIALRVKNTNRNLILKSIKRKDWFNYKILKNNSKMVIVNIKIYPEKFKKLQDSINFYTNLGKDSLNVSLTYFKYGKEKKSEENR